MREAITPIGKKVQQIKSVLMHCHYCLWTSFLLPSTLKLVIVGARLTFFRCGIHYSVYILPLVSICTFFEAMLILWTWLEHRKKTNFAQCHATVKHNINTMVTMGDAIADYLETPDVLGNDKPDQEGAAVIGPIELRKIQWTPKGKVPWFKAVSVQVWIFSLIL